MISHVTLFKISLPTPSSPSSGHNCSSWCCTDIDECLAEPCPTEATCVNTIGPYYYSCLCGYLAYEKKMCKESELGLHKCLQNVKIPVDLIDVRVNLGFSVNYTNISECELRSYNCRKLLNALFSCVVVQSMQNNNVLSVPTHVRGGNGCELMSVNLNLIFVQ